MRLRLSMDIESLVEELKFTHIQIKKVSSSERDLLLEISKSLFEDIYVLIIASEEPSDLQEYKKLYDKIRTLYTRMEKARLTSTPRIQINIIELYNRAKEMLETSANTVFEIEDTQLARMESNKYFEMSQKEWLEMPGIKEELYSYVSDTFDTTRKMKKLMQDQETRAKALIEDLLNTQEVSILIGIGDVKKRRTRELSQGKIILMDGHGRMIWQLLHEWHDVLKKEKPLPIVLVEFNEDNYNFHKLNLPKNVQHVYGDIFDDQAYDLNKSSDVVYYNFTSIGKQAPTLFRRLAQHAMLGIRTHWSFMRQFSKPTSPPPALFSHAFWHIQKVNWYYGMLEGTDTAVTYAAKQVSKRNAFYTMKLDFSDVVSVFDFESVGLPDMFRSFELDVDMWSRLLGHLFSVDLYTLKVKKKSLTVGETPRKGDKDIRFKQRFKNRSETNKFVTQMLNFIDIIVSEYERRSQSDSSEIESYTYIHAMALRTQQYLSEKLKLKRSLSDEFKNLRF